MQNETTAILQLDMMLCDDNRWHFDGWGHSDTEPVFSGDADTLMDALMACVTKVEALHV